MKALSIRQPWVHAIMHFGKRVENRDWKSAPRFMIGEPFLIHAAKGCTRDEYDDAADFCRLIYLARPWGSVAYLPPLASLPRGCLVARARLARILTPCSVVGDPWYGGGLGLVLADVEPLARPIPWKGALGFFFDVPESAVVS